MTGHRSLHIPADAVLRVAKPNTDDRGRPLPPGPGPSKADAQHAGLDPWVCEIIFRSGGPNPLVLGVALVLSLCAAPFLMTALAAFMPWLVAFFLALAIAIAATAAARRWIRLPEPGPGRSFWLDFGLCPACGYRIA
ncbi:MAG: hypothetical protein KIT54_07980 [Phycisphaeraceae bacterium]|nr:hypothetical protein [Phycisphaeraceae bacterium]